MGLKEFIQKLVDRKEKYKELEENFRLNKKLEERQKTSNERELERFWEEKRQEKIKRELEFMRKQRNHEINHGHQILKQKNIFKNHTNILHNPSILNQERSIMAKERLFFS